MTLVGRGAIAALLSLSAGAALAAETELSGFIAGEARIFPRSPAHARQSKAALNPSLVLQPEFRYEWNDGDDRVTAIPFVRIDAQDSERTHGDVRELNWLHVGDDWDLRVGLDKLFWGVAESRHLVDIVNQTDLVEDVDGEDKLGQPMINTGLQRDWGSLNLLVMAGFRERTFAGPNGRLRGAVPVDTDQAVYVGDAGGLDLALRYAAVMGDWDIGLSHFHGTGREPRLIPGLDAAGATVLVPHYDSIDQTGLDVQATLGDWLWKLEAIARSGQGDAFAALVGGFEYTLYGVLDGDADLGVLAEYLYDGRASGAPATAFDDDVFVALRLALNDADDTGILAGVILDRSGGARIFSLEAETRIGDRWTLALEARAVAGVPRHDINYGIRRDHHLQLRLARFF